MPHICDLLRDKILEFVRAKEESVRWFGRQCEVDYSTVYRLSVGEQKGISFRNAQKILNCIEPGSAQKILGEYFPDEVREILSGVPTAERISIVERLSSDFSSFKVFVYAATYPNANRDSVSKQFGLDGLSVLEELLNIGALKEENGQYIDGIPGTIIPSDGAAKRIAGYNCSMVNLQSPGSHIHNLRANLNYEGLKAWYQASIEYRERLQTIARDMTGNIVAVASAISGPAAEAKV